MPCASSGSVGAGAHLERSEAHRQPDQHHEREEADPHASRTSGRLIQAAVGGPTSDAQELAHYAGEARAGKRRSTRRSNAHRALDLVGVESAIGYAGL